MKKFKYNLNLLDKPWHGLNRVSDDWFKNHIGQFPFYYSTPTTREFVNLDGIFKIKLSVDKQLLDMLSVGLQNNNIGYLAIEYFSYKNLSPKFV